MSNGKIQCVVSGRSFTTQCSWTLGILVSRWKGLYLKYRFSTGWAGSYISAFITGGWGGGRVELTFILISLSLEPPLPYRMLHLHSPSDVT